MRDTGSTGKQHSARARRMRRDSFRPGCVLVTGASSGIGAALARHYASPGRTLLLWGRDPDRLAEVARQCADKGAFVRTRSLDLADQAAVLSALGQEDDAQPIALLILAAGIGDMRPAGESTERPERVLALGAINFAVPAAMATLIAGRMCGRGGGRIALIGSVAAFHDLPYAAAYAGSKAGLARFAGALRLGVRRQGVGVVLISPGFIDTPMSRRVHSAKPFLMQVDTAARAMAFAIDHDRAHLMLPWPFAALGALASALPPWLRRAIMSRTRAEPAR